MDPSLSFFESIGDYQQTASDRKRQKAIAKEGEHFDSDTLSFDYCDERTRTEWGEPQSPPHSITSQRRKFRKHRDAALRWIQGGDQETSGALKGNNVSGRDLFPARKLKMGRTLRLDPFQDIPRVSRDARQH